MSKQNYQRVGRVISLILDHTSYVVNMQTKDTSYAMGLQGVQKDLKLYNEDIILQQSLKGKEILDNCQTLISHMPGKIVDVLVKSKDKVTAHQPLLIMEAMKMENEIRAQSDTTIQSIKVKKGENVEAGAVLIVFKD